MWANGWCNAVLVGDGGSTSSTGISMFYVDIPNAREIAGLFAVKADACVFIYLNTTPITRELTVASLIFPI
jgi:hypothetical protein